MSHPKNIFSRMMSLSLLASVAFAALLYGGFPAWAATAPSLGTAESFGVLGGSTVTNTGASVINGDLGVWPGLAITGFPPGIVTGTTHAGDAVAQQAQSDVTTAYNALAGPGQVCDVNLTGQDLGGLTLTPGVYCFDSSAQLTGTLTLNAQGNSNAVWVFQIPSTLTTASSSSVVFTDGLESCYVFWQVGSSATLGTDTSFVGNILALQSITLNTDASLDGRALARNGAVTMQSNTVTLCIIPASAKLGLLKTVSGGTATAGQFTLTATGDASTGPRIVTGTTPVTAANVPVGVYTITETGPTGYTPAFSVSGGGMLVGNKLTITAADAGKTITVTIDNTYVPYVTATIPTLSEWGMIIFMTLTGLISIYYVRRQKAKA